MPAAWQATHHLLELAHRPARRLVRRIPGMGREKPDGLVPPVVGQPELPQKQIVDVQVHRHQLQGCHPEFLEMPQHRLARQAGVGSPDFLRQFRMPHAQAAHVGFIDHRVVPRNPGRRVAFPVEPVLVDHATRHQAGRVFHVARAILVLAEQIPVAKHRPGDHLGVRIEQQFPRIVAVPVFRRVRSVGAERVRRAFFQPAQEDMPDAIRALGKPRARHFPLRLVRVEKTKVHGVRVGGEDREIHPVRLDGRAKGERKSCGYHHDRSAGLSVSPAPVSGSRAMNGRSPGFRAAKSLGWRKCGAHEWQPCTRPPRLSCPILGNFLPGACPPSPPSPGCPARPRGTAP